MFFEFKLWFSEKVTGFGLWLVKKANKHKSRGLSDTLFELAESYNTRPGTMNYGPVDCENK